MRASRMDKCAVITASDRADHYTLETKRVILSLGSIIHRTTKHTVLPSHLYRRLSVVRLASGEEYSFSSYTGCVRVNYAAKR